MSQALVLGGWVLALGGLLAAAVARNRMASLAESVARACHELRGPLAAARLWLELSFRGGSPPDERLKAIELELARAALALEDLGNIWERPRASAARVEKRELVDVAQLLADSVEAWQGEATARGVGLRLAEPGVRPLVWGQRLRLAQAVGNLLSNAIEHGGGMVEVSCRAEAAMVRIEVTDHGAGLCAPLAELARRRAGAGYALPPHWAGRRRRRPGSRRGHGLAVVSAVAARHGGRLAAAPSEQGARLVLELPRAAEQDQTVRPGRTG